MFVVVTRFPRPGFGSIVRMGSSVRVREVYSHWSPERGLSDASSTASRSTDVVANTPLLQDLRNSGVQRQHDGAEPMACRFNSFMLLLGALAVANSFATIGAPFNLAQQAASCSFSPMLRLPARSTASSDLWSTAPESLSRTHDDDHAVVPGRAIESAGAACAASRLTT